ncbi:threonine/serine dehydratase [Kribbella catacumbae]|uniref:threonine/serine dehydratase n=1 Tax=Kribbella catacumbae TaxID=460086 RepID=UPI0003793B7E|nr:threonine/serine dehydratase [Kribbella catacumbae]
MTVTRNDVELAARRIAGRVRRTPVLRVSPTLTFKLELLQHVGSFKPRGAFNRLLAAKEQGTLTGQGIVTASGGNAGLAAAYAARELGVPARIFIPVTAPAAKVARLRTLDADVVQVGNEYAEAHEAALIEADESGALLLHAYDQPEVVAGQGTIGLELLADLDGQFDTVLVAVGGGGLIGGIATALGDQAQVVGIEPELAPTLNQTLEAGELVDVQGGGVAADSLGARRFGALAFEAVKANNVKSVLVTEESIVAARNELWKEFQLAVEHGAAVTYAALQSGAYQPAPDERVVAVICGANTDLSTIG